MLFNSPLYGAFLVATWVAFWCLRSAHRARTLILVAASYAFYAYGTWDAARQQAVPLSASAWTALCLAIIVAGSTLDFFVAKAIVRARSPHSRAALLVLSLAYYLGVLSVFKYWNFAADSWVSLLGSLGVRVNATHLRVVLPFGISFFTFETMSYTIDVYRGEIEPAASYVDYLLFVSFFPHLVSGPIVRPAQMLPQIAALPRTDPALQARGLYRIAIGLAKKIAIGDYLAQSIVDRVFDAPERFTGLEVLLAVYGYAVQIYADFSGYTDVAIGSALLFGYELPENFDAPYVARNLHEFWHRWHISLSTWLRDYLYKPLGGSRGGAGKTYRNLMITMVLGGLWHGASWTFVIWGALHGCALAATRMWQRAAGFQPGENDRAVTRDRLPTRLPHVVASVLTFHFVCFAWIFFRAPSLAHAALAMTRIARGRFALEHVSIHVLGVLAVAALLHVSPRAWDVRLRDAFVRTPSIVQGLLLAAAALALHLLAGAKPEPFVYGQF